MKILFLLAEYPKISETFILHQIRYLEKLNNELAIFALGNPREKKIHAMAKKILPRVKYLKSIRNPYIWYLNLLYLFRNPLKYLKLFFTAFLGGIGVKKFIQSWYFIYLLESEGEKFDLIHAHFGFSGNVGILLKKYFGIPLITYFYGIDASPIKFSKKNYRALFKNGDLFFALSKFMIEDLIVLGCPKKKIKVMHVGVDLKTFDSVAISRNRLKSNVVLAVGRLEEKKGFDDLIYAISSISGKIDGLKLIIIGGGELEGKLRGLVRSLNLKKVVRFLGPLTFSKVLEHMASSNLLALPSYTASNGDKEGTPMVLMDAQGMGLPVVSTRHAGIPEVVVDGKTGILVEERDIKALASAIVKVLSDRNLAERLGNEGRKHIEENFNIEIQAKHINETYKKLQKS